jgi:hypothetical protein
LLLLPALLPPPLALLLPLLPPPPCRPLFGVAAANAPGPRCINAAIVSSGDWVRTGEKRLQDMHNLQPSVFNDAMSTGVFIHDAYNPE